MAEVSFIDATRTYPGGERPAVSRLSLEIDDGQFLVLVGPSGCGKSTSLRMLAGLEPVDAGRVEIGGEDVTALAPKDRDVAMVFQNYALYPHMSVAQNIGFHLRVTRRPRAETRERVLETARLLELEDVLDRRPSKLSGGQRQRVAMGRALIREPRVFLMDEPLSNLDAKLRVATRAQIAALQRRLGVTTVYVTHDQVEAMTMGDRVAVMRDGVLQQCDAPRALFDRPANAFVGGFIGSPAMNLVTVELAGEHAEVLGERIPIAAPRRAALRSSALTIGVRPEALTLTGDGGGVQAVVDAVEELGSDAYAYCETRMGTDPQLVVVRVDPRRPPARGDRVHLQVDVAELHLFDGAGGERLPDA
jgi:multiple sugar transport system ATP-binding protein